LIKVFLYPELNELLAKYNSVKTYTFFIYGEPTEEEIDVINRGLYFRVVHATEIIKERVVVIVENIKEEQANLLDCYQGTRMVFGIAQNEIDEEVVSNTILEGFKYLRYKAEYLGMKETENNV
tara:strand:- start:1939 stop:2307 length:369 start_codon:yes stop_codon:yes gene_type:complete